MERALAALERVLPVAAAIAGLVRVLAVSSLAAAVVIAFALLHEGLPDPPARAFVTIVVAALAFVPGLVLLAFHRALGDVLALPGSLRAAPRTGREHAEELARLVRPRDEGRPRWRGLPVRVWRLLALGRSSRRLLAPYAPLVALFSPAFLVAAGLSVLATPVLLAAGLVALLVLAVG